MPRRQFTTIFTNHTNPPPQYTRRSRRNRPIHPTRNHQLPDWTQEERAAQPTNQHCDVCHLEYYGTAPHWGCDVFPFLDSLTCPKCNQWEKPVPTEVYPILHLVDNPVVRFLNPAVKEIIRFVYAPDYEYPWKGYFFNFLLFSAALLITRKL